MVLSDREIRAAIDRQSIFITPLPNPKQWTSTAVDLTLFNSLRRWKADLSAHGKDTIIDPMSPAFKFTALADSSTEVIAIPDEGYVVEPKEFILGWTIEKIKLPHRSRIAARVEGKSSLARLGLGIHVTAPTIHAGFGFDPSTPDSNGNPIQLEIFNVGPLKIRLRKGMAICQLIFEEVHGTPEKGYQGQFSTQTGEARG